MATHAHRRTVGLVVFAIILPCAVLVALALRWIGQERELAETRLADEQRRVSGQIHQELSSRLERIAVQEFSALVTDPDRALLSRYRHPAVALIARLVDGHIVLPWEADDRPRQSRELMRQPRFALLVSQGEREEFATGNGGEAARRYREALEVARHPVQEAYGQLLLARALGSLGLEGESQALHRAVLSSADQIVDDHGVPLSLYAAVRVLQAGTDPQSVLACLEGQLDDPRWPSPPALYLMRRLGDSLSEVEFDAVGTAAVRPLKRRISEQIERTEQALALREDFASLGLPSAVGQPPSGSEAAWIAYGMPTWLVGLAPSVDTRPTIIIAIRADSVLASLNDAVAQWGDVTGRVTLAAEGDSAGQLLGAGFPDLAVQFPAGQSTAFDRQADAQRTYSLVALVLVVSATLFSGYLLWRDVQRELRLAEMRSNFVAAVSHELKTPLAAIRMFAETLQLGRPADPEARAEYLDTIVNESERLTRLLGNVLDFSNIEQGKKTYRREPHALADIMRSAARAMRYPAEQQRFRLHIQIEDGMPPALVDRDAVEQAILNLLANAMKYSGESRDIALRLRRADGKAVIEVSDQGVGIAPAEKERIFERFYRAPTPENQRIPGTGLGLTLVRYVAHAHGGSVKVDSALGQGSTFGIYLPLEEGGA